MQELTVIRSDLQNQCDGLQSELSDVTDANRDLQSRLDAANTGLQQAKSDLEIRIKEYDEEFENLRYVARLFRPFPFLPD